VALSARKPSPPATPHPASVESVLMGGVVDRTVVFGWSAEPVAA
jgi:hypothetical protein